MRKSGRTTRLADKYIQDLFKKGTAKIIDHYGTRDASFYLLGIILDRLEREHPETFKNIKVDTPYEAGLKNGYKITIENFIK